MQVQTHKPKSCKCCIAYTQRRQQKETLTPEKTEMNEIFSCEHRHAQQLSAQKNQQHCEIMQLLIAIK